jgi:hypothetical protein
MMRGARKYHCWKIAADCMPFADSPAAFGRLGTIFCASQENLPLKARFSDRSLLTI